MKIVTKLGVSLTIAIIALGVIVFFLPRGAEAGNSPPLQPNPMDEISPLTEVLAGTDVRLSGSGGSLPEIAANGTFVALVYEQSDEVYIRAAQTAWGVATRLDSNNKGEVPKLAFAPAPVTNTVHAVWVGYDGENKEKFIRYTSCTLGQPIVTCAEATEVATATDKVKSPDVAVDSTGLVHVAWFDTDDLKVKSRCLGCGGGGWSTSTDVTGALNDSTKGEVALAAANNKVHLGVTDKTGPTTWKVYYYNSSVDPHSWTLRKTYQNGIDVSGYHDISNPTIAAGGTDKVYLAWDNFDAEQDPDPDIHDATYGLVGAASSNNGSTWGTAEHITSTRAANLSEDPSDHKWSYNSATPSEETKLRPSLAVNDSGNFAIVWHQRPEADVGCNVTGDGGGTPSNGTGEIFYAPDSSDWSQAGWGVLANDRQNYSIDPDIAIDNSGGERIHVAFMKATDEGNCEGGGTDTDDPKYAVYYRGPITDIEAGGVFLPIILKNS